VCVAEQGFSLVVHMRNKIRNRLDTNKTGENAIRLKLTNWQYALKKLADKNQAQDLHYRIWNQMFFGNE